MTSYIPGVCIWPRDLTVAQKFQNFRIQDGGSKNQTFKKPRWRMAAILKIVKCDISATIRLILMTFIWRCGLVVPTRSATKNLKIKKFQNPRL